MDGVVIYGSLHGTARRYAKELASRLGLEAISYENVACLEEARVVIYVGALYAGGVLGLKKTLGRLLEGFSGKVVVATVGLADPSDEQNRASIRDSVRGQVPDGVYERMTLFHLRGGIDYAKLGLKHKTMMALLCRKARALPADQQTADSRAMVETYGQKVDFVDFATLEPILGDVAPLLGRG